jgi:carboxypeptidase C (cathepsin A)
MNHRVTRPAPLHARRSSGSIGIAFLLLILTATAAPTAAQSDGPALSTTSHQVVIDGLTLAYTARAGHLPIRVNETGEVRGNVFFTHYAVESEPGSPQRPLTFLWNGGPGANSVLVHLLGFGPKRVRTSPTPLDAPDCDCVLEVNDGTWLGATDLVFVDPIGTGFSRPTSAEYAEDFYGVREDAAYIAEFVRLFLTRFDAWDAPLFIGGESYGTWRAAGVAKSLEEHGVSVAGVLLISGGVPVGAVEEEEMRVAHLVTARTAAAFHHQRLAADLQQDLDDALRDAEEWATDEYAPALARRHTLGPQERQAIVDGLARYTGLPSDRIDADALVVNRQQFAEELLADQGEVLARFDTRVTLEQPSPPRGARASLVGAYLRNDLGFDTEAAYQGLEAGYRSVNDAGPTGPGARWKYNHGVPGEAPPARLTVGDGPPGARPAWLLDALELNPEMRVFVATGHFDSLNSCSLNRHLVALLGAETSDNFTLACYAGGHMMYGDADIRLGMKEDVSRFIVAAASAAGGSTAAGATAPDAATDRGQSVEQDIVSTSHTISLGGQTLAYTARAGTLPIRDNETGEVHANVFFVAYSVDPADGEPKRPVMFVWNGGPGSNAGLLHMTAMGPRRLVMGDVYATADPDDMSALVDNEATWLGATDLVFVDPVGTGYSRPTRTEYGPEFYDNVGDVESLAEFIRVYRTRFDAWNAPLILAGESYGSLRAAAVARSLQGRGIDVAGIVFISGSPGLGSVPAHLGPPLLLPSQTATALYHGKLSPESQSNAERTLTEVREWALGAYADALTHMGDLSGPERTAIREELQRFTGLPAQSIADDELAVSGPVFSEQLLIAEGRVLGRYDARLARSRKADESMFDPREDASLAPLENKVTGNAPTMVRYLRSTLGYESDLYYIGPFGGGWPSNDRFRGDWMTVRWNRSEAPEAPLRDVLAANPSLRVLHASGAYDLVTPAGPPAHMIEGLEPELRDRFTVRVYEGGHSFYLDRASRLQFMQDGAVLIERAAEAARTRARARPE